MEYLVLWIGLAIATGVIASSKGRSGIGYFVLGLIFPLIGLIIAAFIAPLARDGSAPPPGSFIVCGACRRPFRNTLTSCPHCGAGSTPAYKKCPACAEQILAEARKCKHCGEDLTIAAAASAGEMGYCPDCRKLRHSTAAKCVYCSSVKPVVS